MDACCDLAVSKFNFWTRSLTQAREGGSSAHRAARVRERVQAISGHTKPSLPSTPLPSQASGGQSPGSELMASLEVTPRGLALNFALSWAVGSRLEVVFSHN